MLLLIGDIGGTKTILRLVEVNTKNKSFTTIKEDYYPSANFPDLVPIVQQFLATIESKTPTRACFAIAGPVVNNSSNLTNLNWQLDSQRLEQELNLDRVDLINDFAANGYGISWLQNSDLFTLQTGTKVKDNPIAIIGAGTGLGEGFLVPEGDRYQVFATEGGHTDFAPRNQLEIELFQYLQKKLNTDHISVERVVSGQGIASIYQFLRDSNFAPELREIGAKITTWEREKTLEIDPAAIISQGAKDGDRLCQKTMEMFIEAYGAETGNLALKLLPYSGIYLAGGIAAKNLQLMSNGNFLSTFKQKGRVSSLLENIPIYIITNSQVGLLGSIVYALKFS